MKYKYVFSAIKCDKLMCNFMRSADLGIEHIGLSVAISFLSDKELTDEEIEKTIKYLESSKERKELEQYLASVKLDKVELLKGE